MRRLKLPTLALCLAMGLSACGEDDPPPEPPPTLPVGLSSQLADQSDAVLASLEAGNDCLADSQAANLRASVDAAIASGGVPEQLALELRRGAQQLASSIECTPPPPPEPTPTTPILDCEGLQEQLQQLEEQRKAAEEAAGDDPAAKELIEEQFEEQKRVLEELRQVACEEDGDESSFPGQGNGPFGDGPPGQGGGGPPGQSDGD